MKSDRLIPSKILTLTLGLSLLLTLSFDNVFAGDPDDGNNQTPPAELNLEDQWNVHYNYARSLYLENIDKAIEEAVHSKVIAIELRDVELIGKSHWLTGWLYRRKGDLVNAFNYYLGARKAYLRLEDWDKVEQLEENLGSVALDNRSYKTAIKRWSDRLETAKKLDERRVASAHFDLGLAYKHDQQYLKAFGHFVNARSIYKVYYQPNNSTELARVFNEIGIIYKEAFRERDSWVDSALINYNRALEMDNGSTMQSIVANNKGNVFRLLNNYPKAVDQYMKAINMFDHTRNERMLMSHLTNTGHTYYLMDQPDSSMIYLTKAINLEYGGVINNHSDLSRMLEIDMSDFLIQAVQLMDSLQTKYPRYISEVNYLAVLETVSKIKMNIALLESRDNADLIELASEEMEAEMRKELFWTNIKFWGSLLFALIVASIFTYRLIRWYLLKRAVQREYDQSRRDAEGLMRNL